VAIVTRAQAQRALLRSIGAGRPGSKRVPLTLTALLEIISFVEAARAKHGIDRALREAAERFGLSRSTIARRYYESRETARQMAGAHTEMLAFHGKLRVLCETFPAILRHDGLFSVPRVNDWANQLDRAPFSAQHRIRQEIATILKEHGLPTE
jgi:hypothetical protein